MARFLFTVWPVTGHLNSSMAVAQALRARGHEVGYYTGEAVRPMIEGEGLTFFAFDRVAARLDELAEGAGPPANGRTSPSSPSDGAYEGFPSVDRVIARYSQAYAGLARGSRAFRAMYHEWILGTVPQQVADLEPILDCWRPDVVVADHLMWSTFLVLRETRRQRVAILSFFGGGCLLPGPDAPPAGLGLPRPRTWSARLLSRSMTRLLDVLFSATRREANRIRGRYGLSPLHEGVMALSGRVPLHLVCSTPELDYMRRDLPPSVHYVGACTWDRPSHVAPPSWLATLPADRPVVFVTEGTAQVSRTAARRATVLRAAVQGLAGLPLQVILSTGRRDPQQLGLGPIPAHMRLEPFVPYGDLLPRLSLMVTNGGSHGVRAALAAGLPLVIVPMEWDQFEIAQRVVEAGAGLRLAVNDCTPRRLRQAVQRILNEPAFRDNARRLSDAFARYGNADRAVHLLEGLAHAATTHASDDSIDVGPDVGGIGEQSASRRPGEGIAGQTA